MATDRYVGVDVGGTWIKAAAVRVGDGSLVAEPVLRETPQPVRPRDVADAVSAVLREVRLPGPVGITLPCVVQDGLGGSASNIDPAWIGCDVADLFGSVLGDRSVVLLNDADAAGIAECIYGAARDHHGTVLVLTFGTGVGSALLQDGKLIPNTEYGQARMPDGRPGELHVGRSARRGAGFDWTAWSQRVNEYLDEVERLVRPNLIVIGGGVAVARDVKLWLGLLRARSPVVAAGLGGYAGIVGAAWTASGRYGLLP